MKKLMVLVLGVVAGVAAFAGSAFRVTPYVQHPKPDAMSILWFCEQTGDATLSWWRADAEESAAQSVQVAGVEAPALALTTESSTPAKQYKYAYRIVGLEPDTAYRYKVTLAGVDGAVYAKSFRTVPAAFRPIRFVAYSDSETQMDPKTGTWENYAEDNDVGSIADKCTRKYYVSKEEGFASNVCAMAAVKPDFIAVAGDLAGTGSKQGHWDQYWKHNAGTIDDIGGSIPILAAPGNHDYSDYYKAGLYGEMGMGKYLTYFEFEPNGANVDADQQQRFHRMDYGPVAMIFIDPNNGPNYDPNNKGDDWVKEYATPNPLDTNQSMLEDNCRAPAFLPGSEQYKWIEEQLADAQTNKLFTFLVCHHCPYSAGYHCRPNGEGEEVYSAQALRCYTNLIFKYGVDGWICGHDEICEHSRLTGVEKLPDGTEKPTEVHVYDVGYGGDDLRGARRTSEPNPYEVFRAHVDSPEVYDANGTLVSGGKHYGHLEVNVETNELGQWVCRLQQNYVFVSKDAQTGALTFDTRTYPDVVVLTNTTHQAAPPEPPAGAPVKTWVGGGADAKASTAENWKEGAAPVTGDAIVLDSGSAAMTWDAAMKDVVPASWTQDGYTGTVTFETVFAESGFCCAEIAGDVILNTGTWTHKGNTGTATKKNRLYVKCGGDFTLGADATVSADGLGYGADMNNYGAIYGLDWQRSSTQGGSYGGHGGMANANKTFTYGCYYAPEDLGNAGHWMHTHTGAGAVRLDVGGAFAHDGKISANSLSSGCSGNYSGAGGSIFINAASISGSGTMTANSGNTNCSGSGGRIAIILSGRDADGRANGFDDYDVLNKVRAVPGNAAAKQGGPGTIYCETADDTPHEGWMILKGNGTEPSDNKLYYADPFTYECKELHFARLTMTNNVLLRVASGCTLDLEGTRLETADSSCQNGFAFDGGTILFGEDVTRWDVDFRIKVYAPCTATDLNILAGGRLDIAAACTLPYNVTVAGTYRSDSATTIAGDLKVLSGGVVTRWSKSTVNLTVNGDLFIGEGAKLHADSCGYGIGSNPRNTVLTNGDGGSHAGWSCGGGSQRGCKPWGSIKNPSTSGGGGSNSQHGTAGGGVVKLTVGGKLTVDGSVTANAEGKNYPGAGGSVNIRAGSIVGAASGVIAANAGTSGYASSAGGGGRIAIRLTGEDSTFASYAGIHTAYGSVNDASSSVCGGAGTIWLKTGAQSEDEGTLIIANKATKRGYMGTTPIGLDEWNEDLTFGDVIIGEKAKVTLADNTTMTVAGSWRNSGQFVAGAGSAVVLAGSADAEIAGTTTFASLSCNVPGKKIAVADGASVAVTTLASFAGVPDSPLTLASAEGETWSFNGTGASVAFADVAIGGCQSAADLNVQGGKDLGGNSANVKVITVEPKTLTWTGAVDGSWSTDGNWSSPDGEPRAPLAIDTVTVPATARTPVLVGAAKCAELTVAEGAALDLSDKDLTVAGDLTVLGALTASGSQVISAGGDVTISGSFTRAKSTLLLNGTETQTVASVSPVYALAVETPSVAFSGDIVCDSLVSVATDARSILFADGMKFKATSFIVKADKTVARTTLAPATSGGQWSLFTYASDVAAVEVTNCDASEGLPIMPADSVGTGTVNWYFTDTRTVWDGTTELEEGTDLVVETNVTATISSDIALGSIELREGAKLTISAAVPVTRNVLVGKNATLTWNRPSTIGGQLVVLEGANLTHAANGSTEAKKIDLAVAGGGYVAPGGTINVDSKGYSSASGPGWGGSNTAAAHGGLGYNGGATIYECYGSFLAPTNCGSGAYFVDSAIGGNTVAAGGGAVRLTFGGHFVMDGAISAQGGSGTHYTAAGGSIFITAARLSSSGTIRARGGTGTTQVLGGGGRIALVLTEPGADFSEVTGAIDAWGGMSGNAPWGSSGTIYRKAADEAVGTLSVCGSVNTAENNDYWGKKNRTSFPATKLNDDVATMGLVNVEVSDYGTLSLTRDVTIGSISVSGVRPRIFLNGHTLTVKKMMKRAERQVIEAVVTKGGGEIVWNRPGLMLIVR